jgi:hypothetical protein
MHLSKGILTKYFDEWKEEKEKKIRFLDEWILSKLGR